tara:strand:- start:777 stop:1484 length:708 start_codon:yes stop_codon:yes gene_type:complete
MAKNTLRYLNIYYWLRKFTFTKLFQKFSLIPNNIKRKIIFYFIFKSKHWRDYNKPLESESISGLGSDLSVTKQIINELDVFIKKNKINSILDVACGDYNWIKLLIKNNNNVTYHGLEIVNSIVENNKKLYSNSNITFSCSDVVKEDLPKNYDLVILRDFFIHIKNNDILMMLNKIKLSNCKYFAITNYPNINKNIEIKGYGHHRHINIEVSPFNLNNSFYKIDDYDKKLNIYKNL